MQRDELVRQFRSHDIETHRIRVTVEHLSDLCGDFIHVFQSHGDNSVTDMLFTEEEAQYLREILNTIYSPYDKK